MLKKFIIERNVPGVGGSTVDQARVMARKSNEVLAKLGSNKIQWNQSYVTDDKIFCVYDAESKDLIKEHARLSGFPADIITEVESVMTPATGTEGAYKTPSQESSEHLH
jgi:hypothetical protein